MCQNKEWKYFFQLILAVQNCRSLRWELLYFLFVVRLFSVYHLPLFDFLNLITINCECQYFVIIFLKYFFVSVNLLTLNRLSQYIVIVNTKNTIFSKKILSYFIKQVFDYSLIIQSRSKYKTYVLLSVKWEKTDGSMAGQQKLEQVFCFSGSL